MRNNTKRDIIHDTHASSIQEDGGVTEDGSANSLGITQGDFNKLGECFRKLRTALHKRTVGFNFNQREYTFVAEECRIHITDNDDGSISRLRADLCFIRAGDGNQKWINLTYSMYLHNKTGPLLAFIGNPTTVIAGNNIRPIRIDDVSRMQESLYFYRLGFLLPLHIMQPYGFTWAKATAKKVQRGHINVSNTQWALYLPTPEKKLNLRLIDAIYSGMAASGQAMCLAEYLGFERSTALKDERGQLTGVFLVKKHANHHVLTVNFYDKRQSIKNKKQGKLLSTEEIKLVDNALRLDITAHSRFLHIIISAAKRHAGELMKIEPRLSTKLQRFHLLKEPIKIDAYLICRAMSILAIQITETGLHKGSFTTWLLQRILEDELRLLSILKFSTSYINVTARDTWHNVVLRVWRNSKFINSTDLVFAVQKQLPEISVATVYKLRKEIMHEYGIDVFIPYSYWLDLDLLNSNFGLSMNDQRRRYEASNNVGMSDKRRGKIVREVRQKSNKNFKRRAILLLESLQLVAKQIGTEKFDVHQYELEKKL